MGMILLSTIIKMLINMDSKMVKIFDKMKAFTLAEVLITLGIIGVVAAMTIPNLMMSYQKNVIYQQFRKQYSVLSAAFALLNSDYGGDFSNAFPSSDDLMNALATKLDVVQTCTVAQDAQDCFHKTTDIKALGGAALGTNWTSPNSASMVLKDGVKIILYDNGYRTPACNGSIAVRNGENCACQIIGIDVNGDAGPNIFGRDILVVYLYKYGIVPDGVPMTDDYNRLCNPAVTNDGNNGIACAGKMYMAGSMNF